MTDAALAAVLARMWADLAPVAVARVDVVEAYSAALSAGQEDADLRISAAGAAHQLAGALGSYGRPGSDEAAELELLLRGRGPCDATLVRRHATALRAAVTG